MDRLISIIIPVYNCEKYIDRLIRSVLGQSYQNFELILLNDGSTDGTLDALKPYIENEKIIFIDKSNSGVSDTRNKGIEVSNGDLILFLDSDDYIDQNYLQKIIDIFSKHADLQLLNFGFFSDVEDEHLNEISSDKIDYQEKYYGSKKEILDDFINLWDNTMLYNIWNKVYLAQVLKDHNIRFPSQNWGEDVIFNQRYLERIDNMYNSNKAFYHYIRERKGALTNKYNPNFFEIRKKEFWDFNQYFEKLGIEKDKYYEFSCRRYIERILGCIENVYCKKMSFKERYSSIKKIVVDKTTRETLKNAKPKSKKTKIMLIPIKLKSVLLTMMMGSSLHTIKEKCPGLFNKLKNRR